MPGPDIEVRILRKSDDRASFRCGDADLDRYFAKYAGQNQFRHHLGVTYVAATSDQIVGYLTVAPVGAARGKSRAGYPVPVLRVARMAVAKDLQGQGIGGKLLLQAFRLAHAMSREYGCAGVVVDAKPAAKTFYARFGFEELEVERGALPVGGGIGAMFLSLGAIPPLP